MGLTWDRIIKNALYIFVHKDEYTYCLGAIGELAESERVKNLYEYYYEHGYKDIMGMTYAEWLKINRGKKCFDCSGFMDYIQDHKVHDWSSWTYGDMPKNKSLVDGVAGSALWKKGHVGLDIGYGYFLHFPNWNRTCEMGKISEYNWTSSHKIDVAGTNNDIDYTGADAR